MNHGHKRVTTPPTSHDSDGNPRKVGVELELRAHGDRRRLLAREYIAVLDRSVVDAICSGTAAGTAWAARCDELLAPLVAG